MHVNLDGGGNWVADVVVAGLEGKNGVEILSTKVVQHQSVHRLVRLGVFVRTVNKSVLPPPVQLGRGGS